MTTLLLTPSDHRAGFEYRLSARENLGIEYILSALRNAGHVAESINENIPGDRNSHDVRIEEYDCVGLSLSFWEYREEYARLINGLASRRAKFILGGHAATIGAEYFLSKCPSVIGVVMGEGEETLVELLGQPSWDVVVPGFYTRHGFVKRKLSDVDSLAFPARDELRRSIASGTAFKEAYIASTRGCTNSCSFCSIPTYYQQSHGRTWRERTVGNVCEEIDMLLDDVPEIESLSFTDDNLLGFTKEHRQRAIRIAERIASKGRDVTFEITCRADSVDQDACEQLASLGLTGVFLGVESGVQRLLDVFNKRTTVEQNIRAVETLSEAGIGCDIGFIMFSPTISLSEVVESLYFLKHLMDTYPVYVHPATVFRSLRTYPTDLGRAALRGEESGDGVYHDIQVICLKTALQSVWERCYEARFLELECTAAADGEDAEGAIRKSRNMTFDLIDLALRGAQEIRQHNAVDGRLVAQRLGCL